MEEGSTESRDTVALTASGRDAEAEQRAVFDEIARRYDARWMRSRWPRNVLARCVALETELGPVLYEGPVVELGCGTGQMAEFLLGRHPRLHWVGLDLSAEMLAIAERRLARFAGRFDVQQVVGSLAADAGAYAGGYGVDVLHHVDEPVAVLSELRRALRPRSPVVFLEGNPRFPVTAMLGIVQRHERGLLRISRDRLCAWLDSAGFESVAATWGPTYTPPAPERVGAILDRVDRAFASAPGLRALALHIVATGTAPSEGARERARRSMISR